MYGERSSERVNVRVVLHIQQTLPNHRRRTTGSGCRRMSCNWHGSHFVKPFLPWAFDVVSYPDPNVRNDDYRLQYNITYVMLYCKR